MITPFSQTRFEYEREHLFYLNKESISDIESPNPVYLIGGRGSGKTTLLQSLNWEERSSNDQLKAELLRVDSSNSTIGIYIKTPQILLGLIESWLGSLETELKQITFCYYIDLIWVGALVHYVQELLCSTINTDTGDSESKIISDILNTPEFQALRCLISSEAEVSLLDLKSGLDQARIQIERMAAGKVDFQYCIDTIPIMQMGSFGRIASKHLFELISMATNTTPTIKICWDEAECFSTPQQIAINSMVRLSEAPVFFVLSYVRSRSDFSQTFIQNLTQQKADRRVINLNDTSHNEFRDFTEGVGTIRMRKVYGDPDISLNLDRILGKSNINTLINDMIAKSESDYAIELKENALNYTGRYTQDSVPPYYEAFLSNELSIDPLAKVANSKSRRKKSSSDYRKKNVAAYLAICRKLHADVRYSGAEMVIRMSDFCMRDFLFQLHALFTECINNTSRFGEFTIPRTVQHKALRKASDEKRHSVAERVMGAPVVVEKYIDGLGSLTARLQAMGFGNRNLRSPERGIFCVSAEDTRKPEFDRHYRIIKDATEAGFMRILDTGSDGLKFRMHTSLSAAFGFSYRGAYYETSLSIDDFEAIREATDLNDLKKTVEKIASQVDGRDKDTLPLLDLMDS